MTDAHHCPACGHNWKAHDRYGCTHCSGVSPDGAFLDCDCEQPPPAGHRG